MKTVCMSEPVSGQTDDLDEAFVILSHCTSEFSNTGVYQQSHGPDCMLIHDKT